MEEGLIKYLIDKIISDNGDGHKELQKKVDSGEISSEEKAIIILRAHTAMVVKKLDQLVEKVEAL